MLVSKSLLIISIILLRHFSRSISFIRGNRPCSIEIMNDFCTSANPANLSRAKGGVVDILKIVIDSGTVFKSSHEIELKKSVLLNIVSILLNASCFALIYVFGAKFRNHSL